ncbi:MAG: tetratricopeptide repeat protein, partial [Flavobacteriaceae bacterium]|nr:tetratricopeptide repeat protein [Flavobacteriaceae bacterium]
KHYSGLRLLPLLVFSIVCCSYGQLSEDEIINLKKELSQATHDSTRLKLIRSLTYGQRFSNIDSSLYYADRYVELGKKLNIPEIEGEIYSLKGVILLEIGQIPESLEFQFKALDVSESLGDSTRVGYILNRIGNVYMELEDYDKAMTYYRRSRRLFERLQDTGMIHNEMANIGHLFELMDRPDSALYYQHIVYKGAQTNNNRLAYTRPEIMFRLGNAHRKNDNPDSALYYYKKGIEEAYFDNDWRNLTMNNLNIAHLYKTLDKSDSSKKYAYEAIKQGKRISFRKGIYEASKLLSTIYREQEQYDSAYKYLSTANTQRDSLYGTHRFKEMQAIILQKQEEQRLAEIERIANENRQKQIALWGGLGVILIIAAILFYHNRQKQKANTVLQSTLANLKATQDQLIQSEKMASLGELTAGIAHEIQNPLNFVNNFSELNQELAEELKEELDKGNIAEATIIIKDIIENETKVNHQGKRADDIVKGMLQHSRNSSGKKELTDLNLLIEEYLNLAYHGFRAKDKSFNSKTITELDPYLEKVMVVPQDIGRVILNLINNAFYAVNERKKKTPEGYEPRVEIITENREQNVLIKVIDNGEGISNLVIDKIFQPFFTTKPTGQGTGL